MPKLNYTGAGAGALSGAAAGSTFGPIGTGIGAVGGGLIGLFSGGKDKIKKAKTVTPEQEQLIALIQEGLTNGTGAFAELGKFDQGAFQKGVTDPALKNFQENILPLLQEKFISGNQVGGSGMERGFQKAGVDLQSELAKLMYQAQQDQLKNRLSAAQNLAGQRTFENIYQQAPPGALPSFLQGLSTDAGKGIGNMLANWNTTIPNSMSKAAQTAVVAG